MGIAFSKAPIVRATATGSTRAELISSLVSILTSAGWSSAAIANGYRLTCTSPQGFQAALWLEDLGQYMSSVYGPAITLRMSCADQSNISGKQKLVASADREYQVIAGVCQVFISLEDTSSEAAVVDGFWGHHFAAGVPWINDDITGPCLGRLTADLEALWWMSGDGLHSFRNGWKHERYNWAGYWSTDGLRQRQDFNSDPHLQFRVLSLANAGLGPVPAVPQVLYGDGEPLYLDPLIAWGPPGVDDPPLIRGQLYDAIWVTEPLELGSTIETTEVDEDTAEEFTAQWEVWSETHEEPSQRFSSTWLGCLCVIPGLDAGGGEFVEGNHAY